VLRRLELGPERCALRLERVADGRWVERYQASLRPYPLGRRFTIDPGGGDTQRAEGDRQLLRLVPGRAFGTGEHPTTRLCAAALEVRVDDGSRWIDLGCGSGILALVASRSGAARVLALDTDPEALTVAREVLAANGGPGVIEIRRGSTEAASGECWGGIVANIDAAFFLGRAAELAALLDPGGHLLASGFLEAQRPEVERALVRSRFEILEWRCCGEWALLAARLKDAS
jgi:ribosomal protein L11 methyltransferase